jgi:large subunit ribosomal protein L1
MKHSKRYRELRNKIDKNRVYPLEEAVNLLKDSSNAKFDETIEVSVKLGVDPRKSDQMVRGNVSLPYGTGKEKKVLVLAAGEKVREAKEAGADYVGGEEFIKKIEDGWLEFDQCVATPDIMKSVAKLGRILGPRGLMPNPKAGTITQDVAKIVGEIKRGKINFKMDKTGVVHIPVGRASFNSEKIVGNTKEFVRQVVQAKPKEAKGTYIKSIFLSSTMSPGIKLDTQKVLMEIK